MALGARAEDAKALGRAVGFIMTEEYPASASIELSPMYCAVAAVLASAMTSAAVGPMIVAVQARRRIGSRCCHHLNETDSEKWQ